MIEIRTATLDDLERIWNMNISENLGDERWTEWKKEYISYNITGAAVTFIVASDGVPVGEGTLILSPECKAVAGRNVLADGKTTANVNALRIRKEYEGKGHISSLMRMLEKYAAQSGIKRLTIGVEASETRNLAIYLHWGYDRFVFSETEDGEPVLYYEKELA